MSRPKIAVVGHVTDDVYDDELVTGGCATFAAHVLTRLDCEVELHTSCASDWANPFDGSVKVHRTESAVTTRFENAFRPDGTRGQRLLRQARPLVPFDTTGVDWLHLVPVLDEVDLGDWIPEMVQARRASGFVSAGLQGFTRAAPSALPGPVKHALLATDTRWFDAIDILFASDEDMALQPELLDELVHRVPMVVLTRAERGAQVWRYGRSVCDVGVYETNPRDPAGAGDTFAAGLIGSLAHGYTLRQSLRRAAALASLAVESRGLAGLSSNRDFKSREAHIEVA